MSNEFNKPLDTDIFEEQDVEREIMEVDLRTKMLSRKRVKTKAHIKTRYSQATESKITCRPLRHNWFMADRHTYEARCENPNCRKRLFLKPTEETIKDGKIINRQTGEHVA